jgi:ATP-dependent RNA helicase DeaD
MEGAGGFFGHAREVVAGVGGVTSLYFTLAQRAAPLKIRRHQVDLERAEESGSERAGVARGQNVLYVLPQDAAAVAQFLDPVLARIAPDAAETQVLVLTPDDETAVLIAEAATRTSAGAPLRVLPVTGSRRAARLLRARPATVIAGSPLELLTLLHGSILKLDTVRHVIIAWADAMADGTTAAVAVADALAAVIAEVPKDAARTVVTSQLTPAVEALVERYAWRARRTGVVAAVDGLAIDFAYIAVAPRARASALRRLLDDLDPEHAAIYVRSDDAEREVRAIMLSLGVGEGDNSVEVTRGTPVPGATLVVLYESPLDRETAVALHAAGGTLVALATPRQLPALRALSGGGRVAPLTLSGPAARALTREEQMREDLRAVLADGIPARELLALEPLLAEFDGVEVAAAALRLLERAREVTPNAVPVFSAGMDGAKRSERGERGERGERSERAGRSPKGEFTKLYVNGGTKDRIGPSDLVGAIANEAGISREQIGKVDLRETHALVEIASDVAGKVARAITGVTVKGRRLAARIDDEARSGPPSSASKSGLRPRRGDGPPRGGDGPRRGDGMKPPPREDRGGSRGGRGAGGARGGRPSRPRDR